MLEFNKINHIDVLDGLKQLEPESIDLIITSPPYNIKDFHANHIRYRNYKGNNVNEVEYQEWQIACLKEMYRVLKPNGALWYNHKNRIVNGRTISSLEWILKTDFVLKQEITWWQKKGANVDKQRCFPFSEKIYWMTKDSKVKINNRLNISDVWEVVPKTKRKELGHPAVMELEIVNIIYSFYDIENNWTILDPFAGIGTTFIPIKGKCNFIGFEIDKDFCKLGNERLNIENSK